MKKEREHFIKRINRQSSNKLVRLLSDIDISKIEKDRIDGITEKEKKQSEIIDFVLLPKERELTVDEKRRYLKINEDDIPDGMVRTIYKIVKKHLETEETKKHKTKLKIKEEGEEKFR